MHKLCFSYYFSTLILVSITNNKVAKIKTSFLVKFAIGTYKSSNLFDYSFKILFDLIFSKIYFVNQNCYC